MTDLNPLLGATLDLIDEAAIVLDAQDRVIFWNAAAAAFTGYAAHVALGRRCPQDLFDTDMASADASAHPAHVTLTHRLGHAVPASLRRTPLRDDLGHPIGAALLFHPMDTLDALPHGEAHGAAIQRSQSEMEECLDAAWRQFNAGTPFGVLWVEIDQAQSLRRTHGRDACESMLESIEHALSRHMKPGEVLGRWGDNEYLVLTHERTAQTLEEHAQQLLGLGRTVDFRWWGDRVQLTLSIGSAYAGPPDTLQSVLARARQAVQSSQYAGGNHVTQGRSA